MFCDFLCPSCTIYTRLINDMNSLHTGITTCYFRYGKAQLSTLPNVQWAQDTMWMQTDGQWSRKVKMMKTFFLFHFLTSLFTFITRTLTKTTTTSMLQAEQPPPSTYPDCTHSALRRGLMSNKRWVTTVLESSQPSQMPNWSLEVLHNAKHHSLKLGGKNK